MKNMISFLTCSCLCVLMYGSTSETQPDPNITFYQTDLVCAAATDIGCGTRAKPMLAAFMNHPDVKEAWLNHAGTIIAVVWKDDAQSTQDVANAVFGEWDLPFLTLDGDKKSEQLKDFASGKWYKGDEVDKLSIIEADRIAGQLTSWLDEELEVSEEKLQEVRDAFEHYVATEFLAIEDANVIYQTSYWQRWEKELTSIGKDILGDDMPEVQIVSGNAQEECKTEKSCCSKDGETGHAQCQTASFNPDEVLELLPKEFMQLSINEQKIAVQIYRTLATGNPIDVSTLSHKTHVPQHVTQDLIDSWPGVYLNDKQEIVGFWGIALPQMGHKMTFGEQEVYAWCAWDALFIPEIVGKTAHVQSECQVTKEAINLKIGPDGITSDQDMDVHISFLTIDRASMMQDVVSNFCHFIYFFSSKEAGEKWVSENDGTFLLSLEEVEILSKRKNALQFRDVL